MYDKDSKLFRSNSVKEDTLMSCKISRRSFLKTTAVTAAAVAVAGVTSGCSVAPFAPQCTKNASNEIQFGNFKISHISTDLDASGSIPVTFFVENTSDKDLTIYASDFRASCEANGLGQRQAKEVRLDISDAPGSTVLKAKGSGFLVVTFEGVKGKNGYPIAVKLHRGTYSLKYMIAGHDSALVTPQPYFELVW